LGIPQSAPAVRRLKGKGSASDRTEVVAIDGRLKTAGPENHAADCRRRDSSRSVVIGSDMLRDLGGLPGMHIA
jgi:hypothetical protein